jgi:hypothetical protein
MGRKRVYADRADKQRAYRARLDISADLEQFRADLQQLAQAGRTATINPASINFISVSSRSVFRQVVKQVREERTKQ